jgi:hypothetical protein
MTMARPNSVRARARRAGTGGRAFISPIGIRVLFVGEIRDAQIGCDARDFSLACAARAHYVFT